MMNDVSFTFYKSEVTQNKNTANKTLLFYSLKELFLHTILKYVLFDLKYALILMVQSFA
jgi:hypothetical protein